MKIFEPQITGTLTIDGDFQLTVTEETSSATKYLVLDNDIIKYKINNKLKAMIDKLSWINWSEIARKIAQKINENFKGIIVTHGTDTMGYTAAAIGNHDFDFGVANLRQRAAQAKFPFLSANIREKPPIESLTSCDPM